ncbi:ligase-associated DNA damage response endonuclease PdeM [Antarcticibacterium flavum]|uniref:Ligase-associated DNA damage response endonuclease PdeM n=1 Tax=Antarcticibacterium flavum TaxID=2058175 RepID=A0A5B7X1G4_9FLAO|nr:ligase-associated DNA damage response endonuclease PdeM [Antarcticibacterium flavum]MCM4161843.1 ligase-associated DNA damage response endonuclease PdeM [Antarcticibacterium sp. W02-3]QCY69346.1 ligase-associated DNA damage response endonuclease PdeM [Antarcticibacterium flavum]
MVKSVQILQQKFLFHPSGALYWPERDMLLISDVHLGKISHFRKYGSAVPAGAIAENFRRLSEVIDFFNPENVVFLGDLFHSYANIEWDLFTNWLVEITAKVSLVVGNHDVISALKYEEVGVEVKQELILGEFFLSHHPEEKEGYLNICGHLHPGYKLRGRGRQTLPLKCFYKSEDRLILPAFGEFTGNYWISPNEGDQVYAITKKEVFLVN